ncbi:trigger factor [Halalkalibacterium halodurans]|uniref:Trigger factor n=2 Tax=Halalkalibacterium halodurans TaxID=86665 RepID=TIG_HALH5|nr:trigger factor [Halalkalibacterium halodurans]Q9K8F3.1 RecName: Full=Trigger factor; Short=TF; AltName: Full=PPIase [Halalkalibacterium halodurans C-125]MDY7223599.1 trigger factor [Halalkalibacterium halodurans]MDY7242820.1 trigger factor [Halalkalibacterium halodurans]MED4125537.1 trigger factor [Halalkalibacterium halodurans]MED4172412.1 trigger factor [Halalkalibacterium halodurans]TPE68282.1 trigger factor [Halalkalibacterium halodurans]
MTAKWEKLEGNEGVLTVDVESAKVDEALDKAFKKVVKKVNVPGFRKGKVPRKIFERQFGVEALYQDALDILLPEAYAAAIDETGIEPVDRPEIDIEQMEQGNNLIFKATVTVKPEVQLGDYKGLEFEEKDTTVSDEDVEQELKSLQERQAELVVVEEEAIQEGDTAVLDFEGFVDGEAFEGGKAENYSLEIGSGQFIPGFEDQLVGLKAGEEKDVEVTFPEEYHAEELAGKPATFKVKIHDVKRKELPELDDEFAKDVDEEVESLDELKKKLREKLEKDRAHEADHEKRDTLIQKASENATIDIPEAMINTELDRMTQEFEQRLQMQGMNLEMYFQFSGQTQEQLREQMKEDAEKRVRVNLTLEAIANQENLEASDEDVEKELEKMAEMYQRSVDEIKSIFATQGGTDGIKADLKIQKAVDFLVEHSKAVS